MDDVLVDFSSSIPRQESKDRFWTTVLSIDDFWEKLKPTAHSLELVDFCVKNFEFVSILSAVSKEDGRAWAGKFNWLNNNLNGLIDNLSVNFVDRRNKKCFADVYSLLVDDKKENCHEFWLAGGQFILHTDCLSTLEQLKNLKEGQQNAKNSMPRRWS